MHISFIKLSMWAWCCEAACPAAWALEWSPRPPTSDACAAAPAWDRMWCSITCGGRCVSLAIWRICSAFSATLLHAELVHLDLVEGRAQERLRLEGVHEFALRLALERVGVNVARMELAILQLRPVALERRPELLHGDYLVAPRLSRG